MHHQASQSAPRGCTFRRLVVSVEAEFILLFIVATAVAIATSRLRLPYTVALVLAGLVLGGLQLFPAPHLTEALLFSVFLPALIFEAAFHIDGREFRGTWLTLLLLAVPGVGASIGLVTIALTAVLGTLDHSAGFTWQYAMVFGALISATDPVAVVALFRNLGAPRRLTTLLEGESLLNDGTAIVFFALSLSLVAGEVASPLALTGQFVSAVGGGAVVGSVVGVAVSLLLRRIEDPMIEITLTTIAAYGSFVAAEVLGASGVIAAVAAGLICGNVGAQTGMSPSTRIACETFWGYIAFALNSIVFLLIGFEIRLRELLSHWLPILVAYAVVTTGRGLVIVAARAVLGPAARSFPWRWTFVLTWGGVRGALPMVLALSLPMTFAYRELLISMTFGVAVLSILVQGATMPAVLARLGIGARTTESTA